MKSAKTELNKLNKKKKITKQQRISLQEELRNRTELVEELTKQLEKLDNTIASLMSLSQSKDNKSDESRVMSDLLDIRKKIAAIEGRTDYVSLKQKQNQYNTIGSDLEKQLKEVISNINQHNKEEAQLKESLNRFSEKQDQINMDIQTTKQKIKETENEIDRETKKRNLVQTQIYNSQKSKENSWHRKFIQAVYNLKKEHSGIYGTLAELATVDERHFIAVNTVLKKFLSNTIVVESREDALKVVDYFTQQKIGITEFGSNLSRSCLLCNFTRDPKAQQYIQCKQVNSTL